MGTTQSKVTAQGQISIPADVRRKLGVGPGSILEWEDRGGMMIVRRAGRYTSADIHQTLFGTEIMRNRPTNIKEAIRKHMRQKHARR